VSPGRTITESDLVSFSALTGDRHPAHTDAQWAAEGPFGERVAHGMMVLSYAVGLLVFDPERVLALRRIENAVFKRPVRIGDTIKVDARLEREDDGRGLESYDLRIQNQRGKLVARARVEVVLRRERAAALEPAADGDPVLL
jgi:3-hydroxybutyryl-CoA dehydratase